MQSSEALASQAAKLGDQSPSPTELVGALAEKLEKRNLVDIRLSLPLIFGRYYLNITADRERRTAARRGQQRAYHPLWTAGNALFVTLLTLVFGLAAGIGILALSAIVTF